MSRTPSPYFQYDYHDLRDCLLERYPDRIKPMGDELNFGQWFTQFRQQCRERGYEGELDHLTIQPYYFDQNLSPAAAVDEYLQSQ